MCGIVYDIIRDRRVRLVKIYTKGGDQGDTGLLYGGRVSKSDPRCEAYGAVDEAVSALGLARSLVKTDKLKNLIWSIQRDLFTVGAELATDLNYYGTFKKHFSVITPDMIEHIEQMIDGLTEEITLPRAFIIPGASQASAAMDLARSVLRRAERRTVELKNLGLLCNLEVLRYLNRLADLVFTMARYEDRSLPFELLADENP